MRSYKPSTLCILNFCPQAQKTRNTRNSENHHFKVRMRFFVNFETRSSRSLRCHWFPPKLPWDTRVVLWDAPRECLGSARKCSEVLGSCSEVARKCSEVLGSCSEVLGSARKCSEVARKCSEVLGSCSEDGSHGWERVLTERGEPWFCRVSETFTHTLPYHPMKLVVFLPLSAHVCLSVLSRLGTSARVSGCVPSLGFWES